MANILNKQNNKNYKKMNTQNRILLIYIFALIPFLYCKSQVTAENEKLLRVWLISLNKFLSLTKRPDTIMATTALP